MAVLQELSAKQIDEVIHAAAEREIPAIITISREGSWANLHSRILAIRDSHLLLELPAFYPGEIPHEFVPAERIGISFKLKHHKHILAARLVAQERVVTDDGTEVPVLATVLPSRMQRLQRRAFLRVHVPANRIVRASFWLGGCSMEPAGTSPDRPVWSGQVVNLSAGGFQLSADPVSVEGLETGETVGVRLVFGTDGETIYSDAQFRHMEIERGRAMLGFQFIGLTETPEGRVALQMLSAKVGEFQRIAERTGSPRHN